MRSPTPRLPHRTAVPRAVPHCAAQSMMTLDYHIQGLAFDGLAAAGQQVIGMAVYAVVFGLGGSGIVWGP
jgi:hypothetical protein